jgi:hypothetical protein
MRILFLLALGMLVLPSPASPSGNRSCSARARPAAAERSRQEGARVPRAEKGVRVDLDRDGKVSPAERARADRLRVYRAASQARLGSSPAVAGTPKKRDGRETSASKTSSLGSAARQKLLEAAAQAKRSRAPGPRSPSRCRAGVDDRAAPRRECGCEPGQGTRPE